MTSDLKELDNTKEVFAKIDEQVKIQAQLDSLFPQYDFFYKIEFLRSYLERTYNNINALLTIDSKETLLPQLQQKILPIRCELYNFILQLTLVRENLTKGEELPGLKCGEDIKNYVLSWDREPPITIFHILRNVIAHIKPLTNDQLSVEYTILVSGEQHSSLRFDLDDKDWRLVLKKLRKWETLDQEKVEIYLKTIAYSIHNSEKGEAETRHFFLPIVNDCYSKVQELFKYVTEVFEKSYSEEFAARKELIEQLNAVEDWFIQRDYIKPVF